MAAKWPLLSGAVLATGLSLAAQGGQLAQAPLSVQPLTETSFDGLPGSQISQILENMPPQPQSVAGQAEAPEGPLIPDDLWDHLQSLDSATLKWLLSRLPWLNSEKLEGVSIHVVPFEIADAILTEGVRRQYTSLDFFTDAVWRKKGQIYYLSADTMVHIMDKYKLGSLVPAAGIVKDGPEGDVFHMQAFILGQSHLSMLFDHSVFSFDNPEHPGGYTYVGHDCVDQRITGPGNMDVSGLGISDYISVNIQHISKISPTEAQVDTSVKSVNFPISPIRLSPAHDL